MADVNIEKLRNIPETDDSPSEIIEKISEYFLGFPYLSDPLPEPGNPGNKVTINLEAFDCVTFLETVLALSMSLKKEDFKRVLKRLRYSKGRVIWEERNHYMTDWLSVNQKKGFLKNITPGKDSVEICRTLSRLEELENKKVRINFLPVQKIDKHSSEIKTGDIICFGTTQKDLDVKHTGFLIRKNGELTLRHASLSADEVRDESLYTFLDSFGKTPGVILSRPVFKGAS